MQQSAADQCRHDPLAQEFFSQHFPQGFKVLFVGTDNVAQTLRRQLKSPYYHITHCHSGVFALQQLLDKDSSFDLVLSDVSLQDMDGYQFLRDQHLKTNIPHVVICGHERWSTITKAFRFGACYVLLEPVNDCEVRNLWQHVCRKREQHDHQPESTDDFFNHEVDEGSSSPVVSRDTSLNGENNSESMNNNHGDQRSPKKRRVVWSEELHQKFLNAVDHIGLHKAVPRAILERMNMKFLTRDNVASHLQKYRISLNKKGRAPQQRYQQHMNPIPPCNGRFIGNKNISAQSVTCTVLHPPDVSVLQPPPPPPPQNPNNLGHLLEPSENNSDPLIPPDEAFLWSEAHNDHLFYQLSLRQMQPQPPLEQDLSFAGGHQVVPLAMVPPSLARYGSNMLQQFDENLASGSSHGGNMQITQNLTSGTQHLESSQNLASGSCYENNMRHLDQNLALGFCHGDNIKQLDENLASGSSHGGNMQITQNLTFGTQHLESSQNLASVSCYGNNMRHLDQNLALGFCHGDNIKQFDENLASGFSHGGNMQITQNLTSGTQHLESSQNLASGSCFGNNMKHLDQNLALGFCHGDNIKQLDENLASGSFHGGILQITTQNLTYDMQYLDLGSGFCHGGNMQQQHQDQNPASGSCYVTATTEGGNNNDLDEIIKTEAELVIGDNDDGFCDKFGNHFDEANPDELIMAQFYLNPEENKGTGSSTSTPTDQK